ncbi:MAG: RHS repeat protein, partial [Opitutaceae bacterium]|nr:RHS repeat protein [Opitutaceae bacterium]
MSSTGSVRSRYGVFILLALSPLFLATECDWDWTLLGPLPPSTGPISGEGASSTVSTADPDDENGSVGRSGADPIDFGTGAQICQRTLLTLRGARTLEFTLRYYSLKPVAGVVGRGWEHNHEARLDLTTPSTPKVVWSASRSNGFTGNGTTFTSADSAMSGASLVKAADGTYALSLKSRVVWKFSSTGALFEQRDAEGQALAYVTNAQGRVTRITEVVSGRTLDLTYDGNSRISTLVDSAARRCTLTYSSVGDLIQFTDAAGHRITFTYDAAGRALTCVDGENRVVFENGYDSSGRVVTQQDARSDNDPVKLVYDETSQAGVVVASVTNRAGGVTEYAHDSLYRLRGIIRGISIDDAAAAQLMKELDDSGLPSVAATSGIPPLERLRRILADQAGIQPAAQNVEEATYYVYEGSVLTKIVDPTNRNTLHTYDARGNLTQLTDRAGKVWSMTYDSRDNLLSSTDPAGRVTRYTYDTANHLLTRTDPTGLVTTSTYTSLGQLASCTPPGQGTTSYTYTGGQLSTITRPGGATTTFTYDLVGRVASIRTGSGGTTTLAYDANDRVQELTLPGGGKRTFAYDSRGLLIRSTDALGQTTTYGYDGNGNRTLITHPDGSKIDLTYDDEDLLRTIGPTGGPRTTFVRDTQGRLEAMEDPAAGRTAFSYDIRGELVRVTDPAGKQVRTTYDELSRPITVTNARNQTLTATRDATGHVTRLAGPSQTSDFTYDAAGRITRVAEGTETLDVMYGNQGNPTRLTYPDGQQTQVTYDTSGRLSTLAYGGETVVHTYNDRGLLARVSWGGGSVDFTYDGSDNLTRMSRANGVTSQMTYDLENRLMRLVHAQGVATLTDLVITRDALGRVLRVDGLWPLEAVPVVSNTVAAYASTNQVVDTSGTACTSDDDGNLTGGNAWRLTAVYDACNRMTSLVRGGTTTSFTYNGLGWR